MLKNLYLAILAAAAAMFSFSGVAIAANAVDPADGSLDAAKAVYDAIAGGHSAYAAALALVLAVALVRKYAGGYCKWMHTDAGSTVLVLAGAYGTALAASLAGGGALTSHLAWSALVVAVGASGGYAAVKRLVVDPLAPELPAWLRPVVVWLFEHASDQPVPAAQVVAGNTGASPSASN